MLEAIELEQAQKLVLEAARPVGVETLTTQGCLGRVLAENIRARMDIPPFDRSPLDGYALWGEDTLDKVPVNLKVVGEIPAGSYSDNTLLRGSAVRILTGSPIPPGANAVIRQEDTEEKDGFVRIYKEVKPGANISRRGEDITAGESLLPAGNAIGPAAIGVMVSQGIERVKAFAKPCVALASTGDELVELGSQLSQGKIYNSNIHTLSAMVKDWGGNPLSLGIVKDRAEDLSKIIAEGLERADIMVTTGGASVGTYDVTFEAMKAAGVDVIFYRVAMKPGTPVICGIKDGKLVLGLSGNPAAAMISAALLLGPAVRKLAGYLEVIPKRVVAVSGGDFRKSSNTRRMVRARAKAGAQGITADFPSQQQSGVLKSMLFADALIDLKPNQTLARGQQVEAILLEEWEEME